MHSCYRLQTKFGTSDLFTRVCHSVHRGVCIQGSGLHPGAGLHPGRSASRGVGQTPPPPPPPQSDTKGYGQRAGGTHPTWMHSCLQRIFTCDSYGRLNQLFCRWINQSTVSTHFFLTLPSLHRKDYHPIADYKRQNGNGVIKKKRHYHERFEHFLTNLTYSETKCCLLNWVFLIWAKLEFVKLVEGKRDKQ